MKDQPCSHREVIVIEKYGLTAYNDPCRGICLTVEDPPQERFWVTSLVLRKPNGKFARPVSIEYGKS